MFCCVQGLACKPMRLGGQSEHTFIFFKEKNKIKCVCNIYTTAKWVIEESIFLDVFVYFCHCIRYSIRNRPPDVLTLTCLTCLIYLILESTMKLTSLLDWISMVSERDSLCACTCMQSCEQYWLCADTNTCKMTCKNVQCLCE